MNKNTIILILFLIVSSCSKKLVGTYEHTACCMGMGCQIIKLKSNNSYEYISWGDLFGVDTIKGTYHREFKTLILDPILPFEYKMQKGFVKQKKSEYTNSTVIQFYSLPAILTKINDALYDVNKYLEFEQLPELHKKDTVKISTEFKVNKTPYFSDTVGQIKIRLNKDDTIFISKIFTQNEFIFSYVIENNNIDTLKIYYPTKGLNPYYYQEKFKIKKNGLYPIADKFATEYIVKKNKNYKCIDYKERKIIREGIFKLIKKNINRNVFIDAYYDDFYIVFNKTGTVKKVILNPQDKIELFDNISSFKIRHAIKKSVKKYKIPYFKKINYNFMVRLVVDYDDNTDTLNLDYF